MKINRKWQGFTILETVITLGLFSLIAGMILVLYQMQVRSLEQSSVLIKEKTALVKLDNEIEKVIFQKGYQIQTIKPGKRGLLLGDDLIYYENDTLILKQKDIKAVLWENNNLFKDINLKFKLNDNIITVTITYLFNNREKEKNYYYLLQA